MGSTTLVVHEGLSNLPATNALLENLVAVLHGVELHHFDIVDSDLAIGCVLFDF